MNEDIRINFWKWLYQKSENHIRKHYMKHHGSDLKCPNCNTWQSISSLICEIDPLSVDDNVWAVKCAQCNEITYWTSIGPIFVVSDVNGVPLK